MSQIIYRRPAFTPAEPTSPLYNVRAGLDIPFGDYVEGLMGEMIMNGGLAPLTGIAAKPNYFKTALLTFFHGSVMNMFQNTYGSQYDTESTLREKRVRTLMKRFPNIDTDTMFDLVNPRYMITNKDGHTGDEWYDMSRDFMIAKRNDKSILKFNSPFPSRKKGDTIQMLSPDVFGADSLTEWMSSAVSELQSKHGVAHEKRNMQDMNNGKHKSKMISELSQIASASACPTILSAHIGKEVPIDGKPLEKIMQYMKQGEKIMGVTSKLLYLANNLFMIVKAEKFNHKDGGAELPRTGEREQKDETDLVALTLVNIRGKAGAAGVPLTVLASQSEGILSSLTEFQNLRDNAYYGLDGGNTNYVSTFYPSVKLSRTTARDKLDVDPVLNRAIQLTSELRQLERFHGQQYAQYFCTPQELFTSLKEKKYDWDELLATRGEWTFDNHKQSKHYLSALDLLRMRKDEYKPYWKQ